MTYVSSAKHVPVALAQKQRIFGNRRHTLKAWQARA